MEFLRNLEESHEDLIQVLVIQLNGLQTIQDDPDPAVDLLIDESGESLNLQNVKRLLIKQLLCSVIRQGVDKLDDYKKDRVLQKSMLASMHQWVERLNKEYVKVSDEDYNPFKSIMKRNDPNSKDEYNKTGDIKGDRLDINYINSVYDDNLTQRLINYNTSTHLNAINVKSDPEMYMTFQKDGKPYKSGPGYNMAEGSIDEDATTLPQSERLPTKTSMDVKSSILNFNTSMSPLEKDPSKRFIIQPQYYEGKELERYLSQKNQDSAFNTIQTNSIKKLPEQYIQDDDDDDEMEESDNDLQANQRGDSLQNPSSKILNHNNVNTGGQNSIKQYNPFSQRQNQPNSIESQDLRLPQIQSNYLKGTQSSFNSTDGIGSSFNYPLGIVYSAQNKQSNSRFFRQFVPMKGVPKIIDLTKDNVNEQIDGPSKDQNQHLSPAKSKKKINKTFIQGRTSVFMEGKKLPDQQMFNEFKYNMNQYISMDPEDLAQETSFHKKEKILTMQAQQSIYFLRDYKPFEEVQLDPPSPKKEEENQDANQKAENKRLSFIVVRKETPPRNPLVISALESQDEMLTTKIKNMQQTLSALANHSKSLGKSATNYPFLSRGLDVEHESLEDIEILKKHLASIGMNVPARILKNAIFLPRDIDAENRKYPRIIDMLFSEEQLMPKKKVKRAKTKDGRSSSSKQNDSLPLIKNKNNPTAGYNAKLFYNINA
ncbi:UNKNOWN [Stylonychia lemnae]|uniref:Uncharacterized protein n=1 Tax=Stylonychia lemnae TaxID=5949 RepID=A0A078A676_STYLE|nr:UNKNOWN [Stylonychia lemnae]|eukprot:CDW77070.1 UNKNOWN [Stylonychia lemnae]